MNACLNSAWQFDAAVLLTALVCIGGVLLARWVTQQRYFPGRDTFILMHLASMWWMAMAGLEVAAVAPDCKLFWATLSWPGIISVPTFWAVFLWQYVNSVREPLARRSVLGLIVAPVLIWLVVLSNPWHGLFYGAETGPVSAEPGAPIRYQHGPLFYATAVYVYLFMSFSLGVVLRAALTSHGVHRRHYLAFVLVTAVPWSANIAYVGFGVVVFGVDPTPFSFVFTLVAFSWLVLGVRLFDLLPVARHLLLEALLDPVLVVDTQGRVIEANQAALKLGGLESDWQGRKLQEWPVFGGDLQALLLEHGAWQDQLLMPIRCDRYFEVRMRAIERVTRHGSLLLGQMLYLRDVTQRQLSKLKLAEALALSEERLRTITRLHEQLREQALCDPLTGLYNRRYLDELFGRELARARRDNAPLSLALIDLDHFKQLNDEHGHLDGDDVLKSVAQHLLVNLRSSDTVFRIGGEEFLLILPGADSLEASKRLDAICQGLAQKPIETRSGVRQVTLSAGLALWPDQGLVLDELLRAADAALYEAKRGGRNRVSSLLPRIASPAAEAPVPGKG
ncbi:diguanylate cyclase [Pseudomonas daroniae]|uniref:diguanylate cyclase n=1 Tax=Phytopseudomonas daroniae TaxID=2487519 RepID=A0A4Q9QMY8_9GAMM|nr:MULTISPECIES: histidine kinase N-terminal 7TM domain-containing protein [Pseudomonas]TBU81156.1 diguanylate cyclase [Pseudomonas daroniae]TBU83681.1 diguanylate cyclase [Pseudomonas sp. FRB 228]TBU89386.1 diguanylate cyclase [Pseudomonas daroniae]